MNHVETCDAFKNVAQLKYSYLSNEDKKYDIYWIKTLFGYLLKNWLSTFHYA